MADKKVEIDIIIDTANSADSIRDIKNSIVDLDKAAEGLSTTSDEFKKLNDKSNELKTNLSNVGKELKDVGKDGKKGLGKVATGMKNIGKASVIVFLVAEAFSAVKEVLSQQQPILDLADTTMTAIGLTITALSDTLKTIFDRLTETTDQFDALGKVFSNVGTIIKNVIAIALTPLRLAVINLEVTFAGLQLAWEKVFGDEEGVKKAEENLIKVSKGYEELAVSIEESVDEIAESGIAIGENIGEALDEVVAGAKIVGEEFGKIDAAAIISSAQRTTQLKKDAQIAEAINAGLLEEFDRQAELQRQIRDDDTKSIEERQAANDELGIVLENQGKIMQTNADISVAAAQAAFDANQTTENEVALIQAKNEKLAISATVTGFQSEQLVNNTALQKEANEVNQTAIDGTIQRGITEREYTASKIEDDTLRLDAERENLEIEQEIELERLENLVGNLAEGTQARIDAEQALYDAELDFKIKREQKDDEIAKNNKKRTEDEARIVGIAEKTKAEVREKNTQSAVNGIKLLSSIFGDSKALQAASIVAENAAGIAKMVISNNIANAGALATPQAILTSGASAVPVIAANNISTGINVAASIAATAKGLAALKKGGSAGTNPITSGTSTSTAASVPTVEDAPTFSSDTIDPAVASSSEEVGSGAGINQQGPLRAIVLESDITNTQNTLQNFQEQSEIG